MMTDQDPVKRREPSYFDFLMTSRRPRRPAASFAQALGISPDPDRDARIKPSGVRAAAANDAPVRRRV
jgi:hypothetical protein